MTNVVFNETSDEIVAMIVIFLHPQYNRHTSFLRTRNKILREQLPRAEERVRFALVDQNVREIRAVVVLYEFCGVPGFPLFAVRTEISGERFLSSRAVDGVADRRERGHGAVCAWILQRADERAVPAHTVSENRLLVRNDVEIRPDQLG